MREHRRLATLKWGVFALRRRGLIVQLDVAPSWNRRIADGHTFGESCCCRPGREWHPQDIPLYRHELLNRMEDVMPVDPKYDPNKKSDDAKKGDDAKKKEAETEDEEEEETTKK